MSRFSKTVPQLTEPDQRVLMKPSRNLASKGTVVSRASRSNACQGRVTRDSQPGKHCCLLADSPNQDLQAWGLLAKDRPMKGGQATPLVQPALANPMSSSCPPLVPWSCLPFVLLLSCCCLLAALLCSSCRQFCMQ